MASATSGLAPSGPRRSASPGRAFVVLLLTLAVAAAATVGAFRTSETALASALSSLRSQPASGQLHLVEMDALSMAEYRQWPWPRGHYARLVDALNAAGVRSIAFDVDFSAASDTASDAAFADALSRSSAEIILPTFSQTTNFGGADGAGERRMLDTVPLEQFRKHATLGSVSMFADGDGMVRRMPLGTVTGGVPRPSLAAQIAKRSGKIGSAFPIDLAIDPATIPRHSFFEVERGAFDASHLAGKDVLVGATAVELFDRYAVPGHGVLPGAVLQAMAAETLLSGVPTTIHFGLPLLLAMGVAIWILAGRTYGVVARRTMCGTVVFAFAPLAFWEFATVELAVAPSIALILFAGALTALELARRMRFEARCTDPETGLANRRGYETSVRDQDRQFVVAAMLADFDALRAVVGQDALATLFARLVDRLTITGATGPVFRIDDRVLAWTTDMEPYELEDHLAGLRATMRSPLEVAGQRIDVTLGFGIAGTDAIAGATQAASLALKNREAWRYHEDAHRAALAQQVSLMGELDEGIENGELQVFYQPKLDLATDEIASVEALVRWEHPTRGFLRPDTFIPLAEESDRITELTLFVLQRTIDDLRLWCGRGVVVGAAVNISAGLLSSHAFSDRVKAMLASAGVPRDRLTFEITESAVIADAGVARESLETFRELGVAISMDDYGTGQSTLSYLKELPLSELKIDRSFVQFAHANAGDAMLVRSTVQLAHELGLSVVAEGVEDEGCLDFLRSIECDYAQGYLIGKPMTADDLSALLARGEAKAA